ncbi:MAG: universal stress protein [Bacteroidetes bacterium]|nr:universal stress protein [Bacteroidota bacterium]
MKNNKTKIILVPTDFSETANKALAKAIDLSKRTNDKLVLVHVVETNMFLAPVEMMAVGYINEVMVRDSKESLRETVRRNKG